jgi:DNA-binding NarL/FixJ family response regulator
LDSRIIILSRHSIFIEGVATRLRQMSNRVVVDFIDPDQDDYIEQITAKNPGAILLDEMDSKNTQCCLLCELLLAVPNITIVRLTIDQADVQIFTSQRRCLPDIQNLIDVLTPSQAASI